LLMRALLSGDRTLFEQALAELSGLALARVAALAREPRSAGFAALYGRTDLPAHFLPVFRAALVALHEAGAVRRDQLSLDLIERIIAVCEKINASELDRLMSLLRRFEAEAARQEARAFAADSAASQQAPVLLSRLDCGIIEDEAASAPLLIAVDPPCDSAIAAPLVELPLDRIAALAEAA
jgi:hypothetical protein